MRDYKPLWLAKQRLRQERTAEAAIQYLEARKRFSGKLRLFDYIITAIYVRAPHH